MKTYDQLAELALSTIRIDVRCRVMHYLHTGIQSVSGALHFVTNAAHSSQENYRIDQECREPDPFVQDLNASLVACDDAINGVLPDVERRCAYGPDMFWREADDMYRFIFDGIGGLVEHLLVSNSRLIRFASDLGIQKMLRNLSALRQNLKTITGLPDDSDLTQAQIYYDLYTLGPTVRIFHLTRRAT